MTGASHCWQTVRQNIPVLAGGVQAAMAWSGRVVPECHGGGCAFVFFFCYWEKPPFWKKANGRHRGVKGGDYAEARSSFEAL